MHAQQTPLSPGAADAVSSVFNPGFVVDGFLPDLVVTTPKWANFHVHSGRLLLASSNAFGGLLTQPTYSLSLPEPAAVINIVLSLIYGLQCHHNPPPLPVTEAALDALVKYGVPLAPMAVPHHPLYRLIFSYAPYYPIEAYALAAHHGLEPLAAATSSHLLAYDLSRVSDELAIKMGPVYLSRLVNLHRARLAALRNIVLRPPAPHTPTANCDHDSQRELSRAWAFATAEIVWNALPNTSTSSLQAAFLQAGTSINCPECQNMLHQRIQEVTNEWLAVKSTI
ncbi:hypothetical protein FKP32DRAFT_1459469 [Trametes sanguinea]|nr:hypothetical protein FKP32DRAFT_1459469 [Trametes sanguinea]